MAEKSWLSRISPALLERAGRPQTMPSGLGWVPQPKSASDFQAMAARLPPAGPSEPMFIGMGGRDAASLDNVPIVGSRRIGR